MHDNNDVSCIVDMILSIFLCSEESETDIGVPLMNLKKVWRRQTILTRTEIIWIEKCASHMCQKRKVKVNQLFIFEAPSLFHALDSCF